MKKRLKKLICYVMTLVLVLASVPTTSTNAEASGDDALEKIQEMASEEIGVQREYAEETILDAIYGRANQWWQAIGVDHLSWNYFHNAVQDDIVENVNGITDKELYIALKVSKEGKIIQYGRADLYRIKDNTIFMWEVKPISYKTDPNKSKGLEQLQKYIKGISKDEVELDKSERSVHKNGSKSGITIPKTTFVKGKYEITYEDAGNGLILYEFKRKLDEDDSKHDTIAKIKNSDKKKDAKDDMTNNVSGIINGGGEGEEEDEPSVAAIVAEAIVTVGIATAIYATVLKRLDSVSLTLKKASAKIITTLTTFIKSPAIASLAQVRNEIDDYITLIEVTYGEDIADAYREALESGDQEKIDELTKMIQENAEDYAEAGDAQPPRDPLVIDFGKSGIELKSVEHGVNFDLDNNGFAEKTAWIGMEDGLLAYDRNNNGKIDNGGELFGDQVVMKDGSLSASGFEALKELDEDDNLLIDSEDSVYSQLRIWIDVNHNGKSENEELKDLEQSGIVSISLDYKENSVVDEETGTRIAETADVLMNTDGKDITTQISEFWFPVDSSDTTQGDIVTAGNVPDILKAVQDDESGQLGELCADFVKLNDIPSKRCCLKQILYHLTGAEDLSSGSRGGNMDARDLKVIEEFMGREFVGVDGSSNPNVNAAAILKEIYINIENQYYNLLNVYAAAGGYLKGVYEYEDENGKNALELSFLYYILDSKIDDRDDVETLLYDIGVYLCSFDKANETKYFEEFKNRYTAISEEYGEVIERSRNGFTYLGTGSGDSYNGTFGNEFIFGLEGGDMLSGNAGNDVLNGNEGDDVLSGGADNDILLGKEGNDTLDGGAGNDILKGGKGDDSYIFSKGYGKDTIIDVSGLNTLCFKGISVKDVRVNGINENDAVVKIKGTKDSLILSDFCKGEEYRNYNLKFDDASMYVTDSGSPFYYIYGDDEDESLKAVLEGSYIYGFQGNDSIIGSDGADIIYGNEGNDTIVSGKGNDKLFAGSGDDLLDGGEGDDFLYGNEGDDTYIFGKNYGADIISDAKGKNTVKFLDGIVLSDLQICRVGENAVIHVKETGDKLLIQGGLDNPEDVILQFGEDTVSLWENISEEENEYFSGGDEDDYFVNNDAKKEIFAGGKGNDRLTGLDEKEYIFGDDGEDKIFAEGKDDIIFGGKGNDYISNGEGNDYIDAGTGDDFLNDGAGDDTYLFCPEYGQDSIADNDGKNIIFFGDGIQSKDIKAYRSEWDDLLITFGGLEDTLILKNYCANEKSRNYQLIFADGNIVYATDDDSPLKTIYGTDNGESTPSEYKDGITKKGQDGDDQLVGSEGNDFLYGEKGNDRINGGAGDDLLDGGAGNDYLFGEEGNDTYIFKQGYETDTISDEKGTNIISIYGYAMNQVMAYRTNWDNLTISFKDSDDKLILEGFFTSEAKRNFYLNFNDEIKVHAMADDSPLRTIYGTDNNETIEAMDDKGVTIFGGNGDDTLNGRGGNDKLVGGAGNDQLYGKGGNDILDGAEHNDTLYGGAGDDTYLFAIGYGSDSIIDSEGINTIAFGEGISSDMVTAVRTNWNDLTIRFKDIEDKLIIKDYFMAEKNRKYNVNFADGTKYSYDDKNNPIRHIHATDGDDWTESWSDNGIILYGDKGNDHLNGGKGNDVLSGGSGDDYLAGQEGNDTYIWGVGFDSDTIEDKKGTNTIVFEKLDYNAITFRITEDNLVININDYKDVLTIKDFHSECFVFEFADGIRGSINTDTGEFEVIQEEME